MPRRQPPDYRRKLRGVLRRLHAVLEQNGIWHCLMWGTLLGAIRDGDIIEWDHDIDVLIRPIDIPRLLQLGDQLAAAGLALIQGRSAGTRLALNPDGIPWYDDGTLSIMSRPLASGSQQRCHGELWAPALFSDGILRQYDFEHELVMWPQSAFSAYFVERLRTIEMDGVEYPVPDEAESLLGWLYGQDWRTPYRAMLDGGQRREGRTANGDLATPRLAAQVDWCLQRGWNRSSYAAQPVWPRPLRGAGPIDPTGRTRSSSRSAWWHSLEEICAHY